MTRLRSPAILRQSATHASKLERWYGAETVEAMSLAMREFYWPVPLGAAPGGDNILCWKGDFIGSIRGGMAGFASLSDLLAQRTGGGMRPFVYQKIGTTGVVGACNSLWAVGNLPAAGANGSAAPAGRAPTDATVGALTFDNPVTGDTQHLTSGWVSASLAGSVLLLYDRIFDVAKTMNSVAAEAVTGVPTRYQGNTRGQDDFAGGNFVFPECTTVLAATAHNWTVCQYTDQDGNTAQTIPSVAGNASNIVGRLDLPANYWFMPLASGDDGIEALTQMQCSAAVATGAINFVIGHPIALLPAMLANTPMPVDFVNNLFGINRIFDDACLALMELMKPATTATTYNVMLQTDRG